MVNCLQKKPKRHVENVIMMFNHAIDTCTDFNNALFLRPRDSNTVTSLSNNFAITLGQKKEEKSATYTQVYTVMLNP